MSKYIDVAVTLTSNANTATTNPGPLSVALSLSATDNLSVDTVEAEIEKRWFMFCKEIVAGDLYREENFREAFPELFTILVKHRVFNYETFEYNIKNIPDFGNLQAGTII